MQSDTGGMRLIAFYLPQYYPIPENDQWWGKGFTEWTNVTKARPQFPGHYQPHLPGDLGFYDLRLPEARIAQAELARAYGIHGFCYYFYWFSGKRLLERPFNEVLTTGEPDFPFCLCWANHNWTTQWWDGAGYQILMKQEYSPDDDIRLIKSLLVAFRDPRYIRVNGKPLLLIYRVNDLPDPRRTADRWRGEAARAGLPGIFLCTVASLPSLHVDPGSVGFDAAVEFQPDWQHLPAPIKPRKPLWRRLWHRAVPTYRQQDPQRGFYVHDVRSYAAVAQAMMRKPLPPYKEFPCVTPGWDNSPRREAEARIFIDGTPEVYGTWLNSAIRRSAGAFQGEERLVFINAWNEWAEGNHLEPDRKWGLQYLEATLTACIAGDEEERTRELGLAGLGKSGMSRAHHRRQDGRRAG